MIAHKSSSLIPAEDTVRIHIGLNEPPPRDKAAVIATYQHEKVLSKSTQEMARQLQMNGYFVVICCAQDDYTDVSIEAQLKDRAIVMTRSNLGYDFGSWAVAMAKFPWLSSVENLILTNDSMVGPFSDLAELIHQFEECTADVWALTKSNQFEPHLQSFFVGIKNGIFTDSILKKFWKRIPLFKQKEDIVTYFEIGLSRLLFSEGYSTAAAIYPSQLPSANGNPSIDAWEQLLHRGIPLVKKQLFSNPELSPSGHLIGDKVKELYGKTIENWV